MKHIRLYMIVLGTVLVLGITTLAPTVALAASPQSTVCNTLGAGNNCSGTPSNGINLNNLPTTIVNIFSSVVGVAAVIMIIIAGFRFVTASGDSSRITSARNTLMYALVGLVIVALAQFIVQFVLHRIS